MWYNRVVSDLSLIPDFITHYESEMISAKRDCVIAGIVERNLKELPGKTEQRFYQLQEIEAVLNYVDGEDDVIDYETINNEVALLRNRWLGIMKGLETKQWQMGHIVRLRTAGMEDIQV